MTDPIISSLLESDPDCEDIVAKYVLYLPGRLDEIRDAIGSDDLKKFKDLIHDLKGVSGGMGYQQVTELCQQIESEVAETDMGSINNRIVELAQLNDRINAGFMSG